MGTNFYWRVETCESCGRFDEIHVGKRSAGWSFGFRGYIHDPDEGYFSPLDRSVKSRADWAEIFAAAGELWDEYGTFVVDPVPWLAALEPPDAEQQAKEDSPEWMGPYADIGGSDRWRDAEGFRFNAREFS